jgi:predicted alpha/beta hydrolase
VNASQITLTTADGYRLGAHHYSGPFVAHAHLVVAGATAVPQRFYRRFAEFAARAGFDTITFDYRGIGESAPPSLRGFRMDYLDWARLDLTAAIDAVPDDGKPLFAVGHSYGGVAFPFTPRHSRVTALYSLGVGAGWDGWMSPAERLKVLALWYLIAPPMVAAAGFLPWSRIMSGEDLPIDVYRQWKRWCSYPRFVLDDPLLEAVADTYAAVTTPIIAASATDDAWAPPRSRDAIMAAFTTADWQARDLTPASLGQQSIGHMGYFRPAARPLWDDIIEHFDSIARSRP